MKKIFSHNYLFIIILLCLGIFLFFNQEKIYAQQNCFVDSQCPDTYECDFFNCSYTCQTDAGCLDGNTISGLYYCPTYAEIWNNHHCTTNIHECGQPGSCSKACGAQCISNSDCPDNQYCNGCECFPLPSNPCQDSGGRCCNPGTNSPNPNYGACISNKVQINTSCGTSGYECWIQPPVCNTGPDQCSGYTEPFNTCYTNNASQTCTHQGYSGSAPGGNQCTASSPFTEFTTINSCNRNAGYDNCTGGQCVTQTYAWVWTDYNHDGVKDGNDSGKAGVSVNDGTGAQTTGSNGETIFGDEPTGNYTISMTTPATFQAVGGTSHGLSYNNNFGNATVDFFVTPLYSLSGRVFNDINKDNNYDAGDTGFGQGTIHFSGGPTNISDINVNSDGTWAVAGVLLSGTYTVTYNSALPAGYTFTTAKTYAVTLGNPAGSPKCNVGGNADATCGGQNNGSVANLDIGVTNENPWTQSACFDVRDDSGSYTDQIPAAPSCGGVGGAYNSITNADCSTGAGIIFTCNATPDFGLGSANANNWQAGGPAAQNNECFTGAGLDVIRTSYNYLLTTERESGVTPIDMATVCGGGGLASCSLLNTLPKGVYSADGDVNLNGFTFPANSGSPEGYVFLIHGNLTINGNIIVPAGSAAAFSASGNIIVDKSVGNVVSNPSDPAVNNPNLEGIYSADASFIINSYGSGNNICNANGTPLDKKLNIVGNVITNAAKAGGTFVNNRDLCVYDLECSPISMGDQNGLATSYLLTLFADGKFLNHQLFNWQEIKP